MSVIVSCRVCGSTNEVVNGFCESCDKMRSTITYEMSSRGYRARDYEIVDLIQKMKCGKDVYAGYPNIKAQKERRKKRKKTWAKQLAEINDLARENGMTYGQYAPIYDGIKKG